MDQLSYKTVSANAATIEKNWIVIDAGDAVIGRLASEVAKIIRGKHKPSFTPHTDCGDHVVVINADKVRFWPQNGEQAVHYPLAIPRWSESTFSASGNGKIEHPHCGACRTWYVT